MDLAVGADADIVEARTGIRGSLVADAKAYFPGNGAIHLDQFNTDCPLEGDATLTAKVSLFAAASLNLNLEALKKSLQHLVEFVVANNPYTFAAKKLLELPVVKNGLNYLKDQGVISQADLDHLYEYANDPNKALEAISDAFDKAGAHVSEQFKNFAKNPSKPFKTRETPSSSRTRRASSRRARTSSARWTMPSAIPSAWSAGKPRT